MARSPLTTTLNRIRAHHPRRDMWDNLLAGLGKIEADDEALTYARIAEINGIADALWATRAEPQYKREWMTIAARIARRAEHLMKDQRSRDALDVAERHARGEATDEELRQAAEAARAAARAYAADAARAYAADAAAYAAIDAARAAAYAAHAAAEAAAAYVNAYAAHAAAEAAAAEDARAAAEDASAARDSERREQLKIFLEIVGGNND